MTEGGLRERKQERQRAELVAVGIRLFAQRGFDATTVDEVAEAAEVSRRTLFRYFGTKGDIVMEWARGTTAVLTESLRGRPLDEPPLVSLHAVFTAMCASFTDRPAEVRAVSVMIERTPSLRPYSLLKHAQWEDALAVVLRERSPEIGELRSALLARIAVATFRTALDEWMLADGDTPPFDSLDRAFGAIQQGLHR
ncbi:MAG TPA: TetR family transcriptional regulator [Pseudonocardia sp.]|uniref:TetR family transcriptional regulator n=1 Tax=Pseudonocardia sp. TaxID=60912 RepID=UPI002BD17D72|nr:TetR family transcriptional regulator [Pseudonocardia sp.]HTF55012.1 TetR family transcriptional regulator [Pseudonocardia sp.]